MFGTDLSNWLAGGFRGRELAETRQKWDAVEAAWSCSPLANVEPTSLVTEIVLAAQRRASRAFATPLAVECCIAVEALLKAEDVIALEADWEVIEGDVAVAVAVRSMLRRRHRWSANFDRMFGIFREQLEGGLATLFERAPEVCCQEWPDQEGALGVPLVDLLDEPAAAVEQLVLLAYSDDTLRFEVFWRLRERLATNLLVASGFRPDDNIHERSDRLVMPTAQRGKSPSELVKLYLAGTPFESLLEFPVPFNIPEEARFEHCHIIGGTGHGKTQLMQRMIHADLTQAQTSPQSVVVIDSQGDLISKLVRLELFDPDVPGSLADRLVLIDPSDVEFPAALNLFDAHLERLQAYRLVDQDRVLNGVVELYETFFGAMLGAELTQKQGVIFRYLARLMITIPGATIHTLMELMEDGKPFKPHMDRLEGSARHFFQTEFFHPSFAATKKQILKRLWGVLSTPAFERMFAQPSNKLDLFEALNTGKIILVSTAKDLLKADGSALFGRFFVAMLAQAALERSTLSADERTPVFAYVDEAQEYFDDNIETILTQARKYRVGLTLTHQTLDQLTPRLRSAINANTSLKCVGGVSAKDARALADELRTSPDFIESMRRRRDRTEFAVWLKQRMPHAVRMSVPLGFLERQPVLTEEAFDQVIAANRARYCGRLEDMVAAQREARRESDKAGTEGFEPRPPADSAGASSLTRDVPGGEPEDGARQGGRAAEAAQTKIEISPPAASVSEPMVVRPRRPPEAREMGKGGPKHRYLQNLVKQIAEQHGFRAVIEAPLPIGVGQIDVLLTQGHVSAAIEVSVTTPADWERENIRKCLNAGYERVALVLAKTAATQTRYRAAVLEGFADDERARVTFLLPEDVPDYIASLAPMPAPSENVVHGYRVRVTLASVSPEAAKARRAALTRVIAKSLDRQS